MIIRLTTVPPSLNSKGAIPSKDSKWANIAYYRRKNKEFEAMKLYLLLNYKRVQLMYAQAKSRRSVKIHVQRRQLLDQDNFIGGCKSILDNLQDLKLIVNDNETWLEGIEYTQERGKPYGTTIEIQ